MTARSTSANRGPPPANEPPSRHPYGPRPLAALIPGLTRATYRRQGTATARILADWEAIIGPALAAVTVPRRLSAGTLTLACSGPIATELQHLSGQLLERINAALGQRPGAPATVERLRFVQDIRIRPPTSVPPNRPQAAPGPDLSALPPGPVRDALEALGGAMGASTPTAPDDKL
jgi:hypothetical protein